MKRILLPLVALSACAPTPGPDKAIAGAILGGGWGAGSGAIIGNQVNSTGPGALAGAGIGAAGGMLAGIGLDLQEGTQLETRRELNHLRARAALNEEYLSSVREELNGRGRELAHSPARLTVYFDSGLAGIRAGNAKELERLADTLKRDPMIRKIQVYGHTDDVGAKAENEKMSLARARSVQSVLVAHGISADLIEVHGVSTAEPLASNRTEAGRQLNRRVEIVIVR